MKIAIIGTGIAGLGAAHVLSRAHEVELFEANSHVGGHVHTMSHDGLALDTGFIVHNPENYPNLTEDRIRAVLAYAADTFREFRFYDLPPAAANL